MGGHGQESGRREGTYEELGLDLGEMETWNEEEESCLARELL